MFTDRFIKLPVEICDASFQEMTGKNDSNGIESFIKMDKGEIWYYRETYNEQDELTGHTTVYFKNGENIIILLSIDEFEKALNAS